MMLSICIPIYNFDVRKLISDLQLEIKTYHLDVEIILIDDASTENFRKINSNFNVSKFIQLEKNVGRSKIRNLFISHAKGNFLLFLDCDGKVSSKNFIRNYLNFINDNPSVKIIYGGRVLEEIKVTQEKILRYHYAIQRENLKVEKRNENPYLSFQTNNFVIANSLFNEISFNEEFNNYGYEDLLFAMDLKSKKIPITHINNPIINNDLEDNFRYFMKVNQAVESLYKMYIIPETKIKIQDIKLIKTYNKLQSFHLVSLFYFIFIPCKALLTKKLIKGTSQMLYLDFYKLGLFIYFSKRHPNLVQ